MEESRLDEARGKIASRNDYRRAVRTERSKGKMKVF